MKTLHTIYSTFAKHNMAKFLTVLTMLLIVGIGQMWGAENYSWTCSGSTTFSTSGSSLNGVTWKASTSGTSQGTGVSGEKCVQIAKNTGLTLETTFFKDKNITSISIQTWGSQGNTFNLKDDNTQLASTTIPTSYTSNGAKITFSNVGTIKTKLVFNWASASKAFNVRSINITYEDATSSCSVKPTVGTSLQSVTVTENSIKATIPISSIGGCNITENGLVYSTTNSTPTVGGSGCTNVTTTACGSTAANKTVTITGLTCGQSYYIRGYATNEAGTSYTNVTTESTSDCPKYTVTLKDDNSTLTQSSAGESVTLPPRNGCVGYTFVGWTNSWSVAQTTWTTTAPTIIPAGSYTPTADESLYPVYTKSVEDDVESTLEDINISPSSFNADPLGSGNYASGKEYTATINGITLGGHYIAYNNANTPSSGTSAKAYIQMQKNNGNLYNITAFPGPITKISISQNSATADLDLYVGTEQLFASDNTQMAQTPSGDFVETKTGTSIIWEITKQEYTHFCLKKGNTGTGYISSISITYLSGGGTTTTTSYISVPDCCTQLAEVTNLKFSSITSNSITVAVPDDYSDEANASGYTFNCYSALTGGSLVATADENETSHTFTGLTKNTTYYFTVIAKGEGDYCNSVETSVRESSKTLAQYTVTLNLDGGTGTFTGWTADGDNYTMTVDAGTEITLPELSKMGYDFDGWHDGTETVTSPYATTKDITLTAQWTAIEYTIKYNDTKGATNSNPTIYTIEDEITFAALTDLPKGYNFTGWDPASITKGTTGNKTITAQWTEKDLTRYRTDCDACIPFDGYAEINGTYHFFPGETITLTVTPPADADPADCTYQWQKKVNSDYEDIDGETTTTYTKAEATIEDVGHYRCVVSSEGYCDEIAEYDVKCLQLYVYWDDKSDKSNQAFTKVDGTTATTSIKLEHGLYTYYFKITDGCGNWYGNTGTMESNNCTNWSMNANAHCGLTTTKLGTYVFTVDYSELTKLRVSVTYPSGNQEAGKVIYWDNNVLNWTHSNNADGTNKIYYRIGHGDHNNKIAMDLVPGTANLYKVTTSKYDNFDVWHVANNGCWSNLHSIYKTNTGDNWAATQATAFEPNPVTASAITVTPTTEHSTGNRDINNNCEFYNYDITEGMKTWNAEVIEPTNGTITVEYIHHDGTAVNNFTSGTRDLAHTCLLTITATPDAGYSLTSLTVNDVPFTSGNVHTLTADAVIKATWTEKATPTFAWSASTCTAALEADNTFPTLINPDGLTPITYESSNTDAATINAEGIITLVAKGTTTITAIGAETATHKSARKTYELNVVESNCRWVEVTNNTTLEDGDEVVITMGKSGKTYALPNAKRTTSDPAPEATDVTSEIVGNEMNFVANNVRWTVERDGDYYVFYTITNEGRYNLYCNSGDNGVCVAGSGNALTNHKFSIEGDYLKSQSQLRYLSVSIGTNSWRSPADNTTSTYSGQTLKFYKRECLDPTEVWVEGNLTNVSCTPQLPQIIAKDGGSITLTFTAADGYALPNNVTASNATMTWDQATGALTISNPTDNVLVTVEADKQHTITWNIAGDETLKTYVVEGSQVKLPDLDEEPTSCSDTYTTFVGWYTEPSGMETNPSDEPQGEQVTTSTVPTGNATYYAVWADANGTGGEEVKATLDFSTNDWDLPEGNSNKETEEASYSNGTYTIKLAGQNGYYWHNTSKYLIFGKNGATLTLPKFTFKVSKIEVTGTSSASELVQQNIYVGENAVSTTTVGAKNVTNRYEIASEYQTIGSIYQLKVISDHNSQLTQIQIFSSTPSATGYISSCCQSQAVVTVTPENDNLELNIDGTASTTVNISQTGSTTSGTFSASVNGSATLEATNNATDNPYTLSFTATEAGEYTIDGTFTDNEFDCPKYGSATITVAANPILQVSEPTDILSECGTDGTPVAVTIDSRYLTGSSLTAQIATTTDTEHGTFKICATENGTFATSDLTGLPAGQDSKASVTIYVRYDAAVDNIDAATGTLTITDGTTSQTIDLATTPTCGTSIRMTPTDANSVRVTTANGQWTRTKTPIHLSGSYLLQNLTGDQGAKVELTSSNSNFKFVKPDVESSGTVKYESEKITNNTWDADVYLVYTPTTYNANETTTITAKVITFGGTTEHATATMIAYGRSFPETFVLALNTGSEWVALPADMIAPYGTGCATGVGNHDPYPITVDNDANPATATLAPARAVYKGAARNTPETNPWTIQFESNTQAGYYLFGSVYNDAANTSIANLAQATGEGLKWELKTEDNITYRLSQMSAPAFQLGYNATANYMGQYQSTATNFKYDFRILPVTSTCTYYIEPIMTLVDYTDNEAKVRIQYDGTNLYQISMDNKANWTNITGEIDCKDLTFTLPNTTYRGQNIWLKPQGDLCEEVVSSVACHIPAPVINHPGNQNFIGTANQLFSGTFTITGNDLYKDVSAINITTNSNPAIGATISNGTITITMAPSPVGTYTTNITFDAVGAEEVTVKVTIEITSGRVITWMANGIEYEKTEVGEGASPVLPTEPSPDDYACGTKEFVGWTTIAEITDGLEPDPLITDASQITNDMDTLYAVFADCITNHKPKDEYVLVTDINKLKAGDKIIFAYTPSEYVAGDFLYDSSNDLSVDGTATFSKTQPLVIPSTETLIFTLGGSAGAWTFTTLDGRKLGAEAEKELSLTTEGSGITTWNIHSISTTNGDADIAPSTTTTYGKLTYISVFSLYKETSSPKKPQIYKRVVGEEDIDDVPKHRIQLSVLRTITYNEEVREDISFVLPASVGSVGCDGKVFVGWTTTENLTSTSEPADFYDKGVSVLVTEPKTYYAVFATESKNASTSNITLDYSNLGITGSYTQREPTVSGYTFVVTGYRNSTDYFQMKRSEGDGILYNKTPIPNMQSIKVNISGSAKEYAIYENDVFNDYEDYGNPITPEGTTGTATANVNAGNEYFTLKVEEDGTVNISSVVIEYYPTTYSDYTTDCIAITKYNVTHTLTGVESSSNNPTIVTDIDTDLWLEYTTQTGYTFPEEISITMGGDALSISEYEWNYENGELLIMPTYGFTGDVNITITAEQSTDVFTKVTSAPADWSGEYLIVYDADDFALDGSNILTTNGEQFKVDRKDDDEIYANDKTKESYFTIEIKGDYYAIKSAGGKYIGQNDNSNGLDVYGTYSDNYYKNSISFDANGNVVIIGAGGAYLRYNADADIFRYYKSTSYTNQKAISLYKRNTSASPLPARKSNVSAHASNAASKAYISPAARLSNAECIGYQNFTTQCSNVYVEEWDVDKIYIEAVEGMSSVELHSKKNSNYTHIATTTASRNADGTYTITATNGTTDLSDIACEKMRISIKDASNNVIAAQLYKVPIIVENAIKTNDNWFVTTLGASTCANCDVIIRDNAVLEHVTGGVNDFRNLTIYESAALRNEQTILSVEDLLIRSKLDDVGYAIIEKDNGFISANTVAHTKRIDAAYWYTFALPYDCKIADITQANGKSMGEYGKDWGIKYYDGQARQASGTTAGQGNSSQFWEPMPANGVLEANHGYIIALFDASVQDDNEMRTIYFPPAENKEYTESGTDSKATTIVNWTDNLECDQQHHGWNFTSTPYISIFNPSEMADNEDGAGMNASNVLMKGKINLVDGSYYEETLEDVYVSIPSTQGAKYYDQQLASSTSLMPFSAYFVQAVDPETGSSETKTLTYAKGARTLPTSAPARAAATKQRVLVELKTTAPDGQTDNTGVWVDERYTTNYEIAADLTKMYATGTKPQLYTWANNQRMAYNALPDNAATYVPLGLYAPVAGNYMIAINQRVSRLQGAESVELLYNNAVVANLLVQDYILTANQGENNGYALRVNRKAQVSTATDNISGSTITLIANDGYISLTGVPTDAKVNIYDMLGRLIATQNADGQTVINMPMIPQGVYNIVINSTNGHQTMKTIIR